MRDRSIGVVSLNYAAWGLLPLFWKLLEDVDSIFTLAQRIVWASVFSGAWLLLVSRTRRKELTSTTFSGFSLKLMASSVIISLNWGIYIWAVNNGFVSYAALGYFLAPLISVILGAALFHERTNPLGWAAATLTALGSLIYGWGQSGWGLVVVFGIAVTFSIYGAVKKTVSIDPVPGLFSESGLLVPVALVLLLSGTVTPATELSTQTWALLACSGLVTLMPLVILSHYARKVPLSTLGMLQFILPVVQLFLGLRVFGEEISATQAVALFVIGTGVGLYLWFQRDQVGRAPAKSW